MAFSSRHIESLQNLWDSSAVKAYLDRRDRRVRNALLVMVALIPVALLYIALRPAPPEPPSSPKKEQKERGPVKFVMPAFLDISRPATPADERPGPLPKSGRNALVYFFHMTGRTAPDLALEEYAREGIKKSFANGYKGWNVWFSPVNLQEGTNDKYLAMYSLSEKAVVVQKFSGDAPQDWRVLDRAWLLADSSSTLAAYLAGETKRFLDEGLAVAVSTVPGVVLPPNADTAAQDAAALQISTAAAAGQVPEPSQTKEPAAASTSSAAGSPLR